MVSQHEGQTHAPTQIQSQPHWQENKNLEKSAAKKSFPERLVKAALARTKLNITYDGRYFSIRYPGGDVPQHLGVCTDVIIRSYRALGIDLQHRVHEDMKKHFPLYPKRWGDATP